MKRIAPLLAWLAGLAVIPTAKNAGAQVMFSGLGDLPGDSFESAANAVSADGRIVVGNSLGAAGPEAFRWEGGAMMGLGFLADPGPTGEFQSLAYGVSANGSVIVGSSDNWRIVFDFYAGECVTAKYFELFRFRDGLMTPLFDGLAACELEVGSSTFGIPLAANADGSVIVGWGFIGGFGAFVWDDSNGMRDLKEVLESDFGLDLTGWRLDRATGVSADGRVIVGYGRNPRGDQEGWIAVLRQPRGVPAFSAPGLLIVGGLLVGTALWAIRRRLPSGSRR